MLLVIKEVEKALIDLSRQEDFLTESDVAQLRALKEHLEVVLISSNKLASNESDTFTADCVIEFLLDQTASGTSEFGNKLNEALEKRVLQRRNMRVAGLLRYLSSNDKEASTLDYPSKAELTRFARDIYSRLFGSVDEPTEPELTETEPEPEPEQIPKRSKLEELNCFLLKAKSGPSFNPTHASGAETLQVEFHLSKFVG